MRRGRLTSGGGAPALGTRHGRLGERKHGVQQVLAKNWIIGSGIKADT